MVIQEILYATLFATVRGNMGEGEKKVSLISI
jgi:hypothetical protein